MEKSVSRGRVHADLIEEKRGREKQQQQRGAEEDPDGFVPVTIHPPSAGHEIVSHHAPETIHQHHHYRHAHGTLVQHRQEDRFHQPNNAQTPTALPTTTAPEATPAGHHQDSQLSSTHRRRRGFRVPFVGRVTWVGLWKYGKDWVRRPANFAVFLWLIACGIALLLLLLLVVGALNSAITNATTRRQWIEAVNQVLNALFTIMCLYQHPRITHHLIMLVRWRERDAAELRGLYCRYKNPRPKERWRLLFVLALLHITCFAQYSLCAIFWAYNRHNRPDLGQIVCLGVGIVAPVVAAIYTLFGPLAQKDAGSSSTINDEESAAAVVAANDVEMIVMEERVTSEMSATANWGKAIVTEPKWSGGLFGGLLDDASVVGLSFFCTFCVFGWNMERLGLGNMYVHVATFLLLCLAPFWVFVVTGLKIDDDGVMVAVWIVGLVLSFLGMLYGGYWRTRMRRHFRLPADGAGYAALADYAKWLFCWTCALAQEVRTGNAYHIQQDHNRGSSAPVVLLSREGGRSERVFAEEAAVLQLQTNKQSLRGEEKAGPLSAPMPTTIPERDGNGRR